MENKFLKFVNDFKTKHSGRLLNYFALIVFGIVLILVNTKCVESLSTDPTVTGGTTTVTGDVNVELVYPANGDSIVMGKNIIQYNVSDVVGGSGFYAFSVYLAINSGQPIEFQNFPVIDDGVNPEIYIHTDSIESKFDLVPGSFPSRVRYWVTAYSNTNNIEPQASEIQDSVYVNRRPEKPESLVLIRNSSTSFTLFWEDVSSNETRFELWRKDGANGGFIKLNHDIPANNISVFDFVESYFITYYYRIKAVNQYGESAFSNEVNSSALQGGNQPTNLRAEALGASKIRLTWVDNSVDELGFKIERKNPVTGEYEQISGMTSNVEEYIDINLTPGTSYTYRVASFTSKAQSAWSNEATATTYTEDVSPPIALIATFVPEDNHVLVKWTDPTISEKGGVLERKDGLTGNFLEIALFDVNTTRVIDEDIQPNTLYTYRAKYITDASFYTDYSNEDTVFVPVAAPKTPTNLTIRQFTDFAGNILYGLIWEDNADDESGYEIERSDNGAIYTYYAEVGENGFAFNDNPTVPPVYWYRVRAFRILEDQGRVYSKYSNVVNTDGGGSRLPAPLISGSQPLVGVAEAKINWSYSHPDALGFIVERKLITETEFIQIAIKGINEINPVSQEYEIYDASVQFGATYVYRIRAYSSNEESANSNTVSIYIQNF